MAVWTPGSNASLQRNFAAQFEEERGRLVFRANGTGAAIPVSAAERDAFTAGYDRSLAGWRWRMMLWLVPGILLAAVVSIALHLTSGPAMTMLIFAGIAPGFIVSVRALYRARSAPKRELAGRAAIAPALDRDVARAKALRAVPWPSLALVPGYAAFLVWRYDVLAAPFAPNHLLWTVLAAGLCVLGAVQAVRKWRVERAGTGTTALGA